MTSKKYISTAMAVAMVATSVAPVMAATTTSNEEIIGKNRTETAVKISQDGWKKAETVILVNDSAIPDALTATPLAYAKNAPILLTGKDGLSKETADEIKRLGAKDVIMIGGDAVLTSKVEEGLKALKLKVDRIKGSTREETALAIAKRLDGIKDVSEIAVVNGVTGLADAVSVAAAAAEKGMPILLANPKSGLTLVEKFIKDESIKSSFIIGGDKAVSNEIVKNLPGKQRIEGANRNETNAKVIEKFYADRELDNLYVAKDGMENSGHLIDALAVGSLAAKNGAPVLIASKKLNEKQINVINTKKISTITQVGGNGNEKAFDELKEIEKSETIKVKNEVELQEALKKANANDVIEIESSASISKDVTLSTNNAVEINVKGDLKGEVTVKAPNADIKNSGSIGTLVVENGKNTTVTNASGGKIDKVEVSSSSENVKVENKGTITQVENNATGTTIENNGTISKPVTGTEKPSVEGNKPGGSTSGGGSSTPSIEKYAAEINGKKFNTLEEAVNVVLNSESTNNVTIKLLKNSSGNGIVFKGNNKNITIDLNGYTYTIDGTTVGSSGTETNAFQLLKGNTVTIKNGTLTTTKGKILLQNYCDLTLENLTLIGGDSTEEVLSCNTSTTKLINVNISGSYSGFVGIDVMHYPANYATAPIVIVNNKDTNKVDGKVKVYCNENPHEGGENNKATLIINSGKFTEEPNTPDNNGIIIDNRQGTYAAEVNGKIFKTLEEAMKSIIDAESKEPVTVNLLKDSEGNGVVFEADKGKNITIDLNNHKYIISGKTVGSTGTETNGFQLKRGNTISIKNGTLETTKGSILLQNYCDLSLENLTLVGKDVTGVILSCNNGNTVLENVNIYGSHLNLFAIDVMHWHGSYDDNPTVTINNTDKNIIQGKVTKPNCYKDKKTGYLETCDKTSKLIINGGTFEGLNGKVFEHPDKKYDNEHTKNNLIINSGIFAEDVSSYCGTHNCTQSGSNWIVK